MALLSVCQQVVTVLSCSFRVLFVIYVSFADTLPVKLTKHVGMGGRSDIIAPLYMIPAM